MSDMRLLIIISAFSRGGAQKVLLDLIPEWAKKGIKIRIILLQDSEDELDYTSLKILGIEVIRIKATSFFDVKAMNRAVKTVLDFAPNQIQCHLYLAQIWGAFLKLSAPRSRLVWVEHNMYFNRSQLEWFLFRVLSRFVYEVIAVSQEVSEFVSTKGVDQIRCIPNSVSPVFSLQSSNHREQRIVFAGRFNDQKNPLLALKSLEMAIRDHLISPNVKLCFAGDGPLKALLQNYVTEKNLTANVEFLGFLNTFALSKLLNESKVLISTSKHEGCPLVRLEALAAGCCVITTPTGGVTGILTTERDNSTILNGVFVVPNLEQEISAAIVKAFQDQYWNYDSISFRANHVKQFSPEKIALQYLSN